MDKILLTVFLSALAGFITAILSIVKLVNEKESKTTDYRQSWTESVRAELADLIGLLNTQAHNLMGHKNNIEAFVSIHSIEAPVDTNADKIKAGAAAHASETLKSGVPNIRETRQRIYQSYARARLHFKPDDLSFSRVEQQFAVVIGLLKELEDSEEKEVRGVLREKVHSATNEMTGFCRNILKGEWEHVKKGERAYQLTKKWSIAGSIVMFFILLSIAVHTGIAILRNNSGVKTELLTK